MCGIVGYLDFDGKPAQSKIVEAMAQTLEHRGPDGQGIHIDGPVGLGHRRLSIIDLSSAGTQPMPSYDRTLWVTFNGEIYNFLEIRQDLVRLGYQFRSLTDTEVILYAYEEWGIQCLQRFNGMFAFCLWDQRQQTLWLARDRLGIKPLFYIWSEQFIAFASEIKAVLQHPQVKRTLDYEALSYYLALNYVPAPHTLFSSIRQLMPGQALQVDINGKGQIYDYWQLRYQESDYQSESAYLEEFEALLSDSVRLRLMSDVPFGAFLSGGLDSSSIAYWMTQHLREPVKAFSIGFGEPSFDELDYAHLAAKSVGAQFHTAMVQADAATILPKLVWHAEEPTADSSMVAVFHLAAMAREHVTMTLGGDGADEILAGYETYQAYFVHQSYRRLPVWFRQHLLQPLVDRLPTSDAKVSWDFKLKRFVAAGDLSSEDAHGTWRMIFSANARARLLDPIKNSPQASADVLNLYRATFAQTNARHALNRMLYVDTRFYLPNDMLVKVDRMSMAHGLEVRVPFLDHRLVEFAARVPPNLKLKHFRHKKYLLKAAMQGRLPNKILWRRKQGFNIPNGRWFKGELKSFVMEHLSIPKLKDMGFLDSHEVSMILCDHFEERKDNSHQIWCLLTLSLWWQQFIQNKI